MGKLLSKTKRDDERDLMENLDAPPECPKKEKLPKRRRSVLSKLFKRRRSTENLEELANEDKGDREEENDELIDDEEKSVSVPVLSPQWQTKSNPQYHCVLTLVSESQEQSEWCNFDRYEDNRSVCTEDGYYRPPGVYPIAQWNTKEKTEEIVARNSYIPIYEANVSIEMWRLTFHYYVSEYELRFRPLFLKMLADLTEPANPITERMGYEREKLEFKPLMFVYESNEYEMTELIGSFRMNPLGPKMETDAYEEVHPFYAFHGMKHLVEEENRRKRQYKRYHFKEMRLTEFYEMTTKTHLSKALIKFESEETFRKSPNTFPPTNEIPAARVDIPIHGVPPKIYFRDTVDVTECPTQTIASINASLENVGIQVIDIRLRKENVLGMRLGNIEDEHFPTAVIEAVRNSVSTLDRLRTYAHYFVITSIHAHKCPMHMHQIYVRFKPGIPIPRVWWIENFDPRPEVKEDDYEPLRSIDDRFHPLELKFGRSKAMAAMNPDYVDEEDSDIEFY